MKRFLAAMRFLTILPLPGSWGTAAEELAGSVLFFPLIGLLLGGLAAAVAWGAGQVLPPMVTAVALIILMLAFSGCLHLDGLADTADGFLSSRDRSRVLEIMKDSHIGAMGVVAIVAVLLAKFAALASQRPEGLWPTLLLMPLAGRCALVIHLALLPCARPEGLGAVFYQHRPRWAALWAAGLLAGAAWALLEWRGLIVWAACMAMTSALAFYVYRKIGGTTGDTLGAACEIVEAMPALAMTLAIDV